MKSDPVEVWGPGTAYSTNALAFLSEELRMTGFTDEARGRLAAKYSRKIGEIAAIRDDFDEAIEMLNMLAAGLSDTLEGWRSHHLTMVSKMVSLHQERAALERELAEAELENLIIR